MSKKDETKKFDKVPQVEIDGRLFHADAEVSFGITKETIYTDVGGNQIPTRIYRLKKKVTLGDKVWADTVVRAEEGSDGRETIKNQLEIEVRKYVKGLDK